MSNKAKISPEIHIFSGLMSSIIRPFQRGTLALEKMIDTGSYDEDFLVDAQHHIWNSWRSVANRIIRLHNTGKLNGPVILIGHSNGVLACCKIAERLYHKGIKVHYIGAIDPTAAKFSVINVNVGVVDEFWATSGYPCIKRFITRNKRAACQFTSEFNISGSHNKYEIKGSHIGVSKNKKVANIIFSSIKNILDN